MITTNTIHSINQLFEHSLRACSLPSPDDRCTITFRPDPPQVIGEDHRLIVLTISSYGFRIVALSDFNMDTVTTSHLARMARSNSATLAGQALLDAYAEFLNMVCGGVNRSLNVVFPYTGMSTPFLLEHSCLQYLSVLNPAHTQYIDMVINDTVRFGFTVCLCVNQESPLDLRIDKTVQEASSSGELELF